MAYCNSKSLYRMMSSTKKSSACGYYNHIDIPKDLTDNYITITGEYENKPGKLAYDLYGSERFSWVFSYFNRDTVNDPIFDLTIGKTIRVPTKERLKNYF